MEANTENRIWFFSKSVNQHREAEKSRSGHNSEKMGCKLSSRFCRSKQYSDDCEAAGKIEFSFEITKKT